MTIKIQQILNFSQFYAIASTNSLPIKTAYKLSRLSKSIAQEVEFYQTELNKIITKYALKDEQGNLTLTEDKKGFRVDPEFQSQCANELNELSNLDIELPDISFDIDEFDSISLNQQEILGIIPFIKEN